MQIQITHRQAIIVARKMRQSGYNVRAGALVNRTINDAAVAVAGATENPRDVAETIIGVMKFSCPGTF